MTLLFTDIEGSTRLWEDHPDLMPDALVRHDDVLRTAVEAADGFVFKTVGDAFCVAFATAPAAVAGAVAAQRALAAECWRDPVAIRVRMGLHSGECVERDGDYFGPTVNRAARLEAIAHGEQIVVSAATRRLLGDALPERARLRDLGEHRLKDLGSPEHVFQLEADDLRATFPALRSLDSPELPNNLPGYPSSFVGRGDELDAVRELVRQAQLVTLTGPGGAGKTRLAVQVGAELLDRSGDGVWLVDLAPMTDDTMVPTAIADALGMRTGGSGLIDGLVTALVDRRLLLVLDNCEHLIDAVAASADRVLRSCPEVHVLATSREPLGITGEVVYRVPSLRLPDALEDDPNLIAPVESVRLLSERARLHDAGFTVNAANAAAVAAVCRRLDGIPLALELAAARLRSMSPEELLRRLDQRFRLLTGGSRTAMARQQTLRATIDWSFELLDARERTVLTRVSVFAGGWDLPAAEAVTADGAAIDAFDVLDVLTGLADKSLVNLEAGPVTRYRMLETIREYAAEKLAANGADANASLRRLHLAHYLSIAELAAAQVRFGEQRLWLDRLEADHDNLRTALVAALDLDEVDAGLRLGTALHTYAYFRARGRDLVEPFAALVGRGDGDPQAAADGRSALAFLQLGIDDYERAEATLEPARVHFRSTGDGRGLAYALGISAWLSFFTHGTASAEQIASEGLAAAEAANDVDTTARMHGIVAIGLIARGDLDGARRHLALELAGCVQLGDGIGQSLSETNLGELELLAGNIDAADASFESAERIARELDLPGMVVTVILSRANIDGRRDDDASALARTVEAMSLAHRHGILRWTTWALVGCARALLRTDAELAATMHGAALRRLATQAFQLQPLEAELHEGNESRLRAALADDVFDRLCAEGAELPVRDLITKARTQLPL